MKTEKYCHSGHGVLWNVTLRLMMPIMAGNADHFEDCECPWYIAAHGQGLRLTFEWGPS